jgi:hypothetical protein
VYWSKGFAEGAIDVQTLKPGTPLYTSPAAQLKQEPVGEVTEVSDNGFKCEFNQRLAVGTKLYIAPPLPVQRKPLTDDVLVPMEILEAAASSLDSFCGNLGWGDADLQNMDNLFALISQHKAAYNIKEKTND